MTTTLSLGEGVAAQICVSTHAQEYLSNIVRSEIRDWFDSHGSGCVTGICINLERLIVCMQRCWANDFGTIGVPAWIDDLMCCSERLNNNNNNNNNNKLYSERFSSWLSWSADISLLPNHHTGHNIIIITILNDKDNVKTS
jgi:hypothetical protein